MGQAKGIAGADVVARKIGKVAQDVVLAHARREPVEHVIDRDAQAADARLAAALAGLDGDDPAIVHGRSVLCRPAGVKRAARRDASGLPALTACAGAP